MIYDPPVKADGTCTGCGKPRRPERSRRYAKEIAELDPWCSTECCREYHNVVLPEGLMERAGSPKGRPTKGIWKDEGWDEVAA